MKNKRLSRKTIEKEFYKLGFANHNGQTLFKSGCLPSKYMSIRLPDQQGGNIKITEARWIKKHNVHIISYWLWPKNLKELSLTISEIKTTYSELCGIEWNNYDF